MKVRSVNKKSSVATRPVAERTRITARMISCWNEKSLADFVEVSPVVA